MVCVCIFAGFARKKTLVRMIPGKHAPDLQTNECTCVGHSRTCMHTHRVSHLQTTATEPRRVAEYDQTTTVSCVSNKTQGRPPKHAHILLGIPLLSSAICTANYQKLKIKHHTPAII